MRGRRILELGLAAMIASGGLFAAFVPGAASDAPVHDLDPSLTGHALPTPRVNPAQLRNPEFYRDLRISEASRRVANAVMSHTVDLENSRPDERIASPHIAMEGFAISPRAQSESGDGWSASALGVQVRVNPETGVSDPQWWIVGGAGRESYAVSPGSLREFTVAPFSSETVIGDTHVGVAVKLSDRAHASFGYVREKREFHLGREDWEEDEHFLGVGLHARW
ncbi:hypothetical protein [Oceanicaulis sp. HTCC2633]|jgi:hypothetical protein|uniref:hypothetical protein n=1 Tax=Oceanicaulis sp. HTCC2633 TaxID=314254 RepID=UPI0003268769|nr:hypothetical protein [Oceanicaulis sp. HTCC2633]